MQFLREAHPHDHEGFSLLENAIAEPTRTFLLSKARHQTDTLYAFDKIGNDAGRTRHTKRAAFLPRAPLYLQERVAALRPLPVVKLSDGMEKREKKRQIEEDGEEEKLLAVLRYVLQAQEEEEEKKQGGGSKNRNGGMLPEVFVELMEMMAPKWDPIRGEA